MESVSTSILVILIISRLFTANTQYQSPCPEIFEYRNDNSGVYGEITLKPNGPLASITIRTNFTILARLQSEYFGSIEPYGREQAIQEYNRGMPIKYRVNFPLSSSLPKLTALYVNDNILCFAYPDIPASNEYLTTITLQHTLFIKSATYNLPASQTQVPNYVNNVGNAHVFKIPSSYVDQTTFKTTYYYATHLVRPESDVINSVNRPQLQFYPEEITFSDPPRRWPSHQLHPQQTQPQQIQSQQEHTTLSEQVTGIPENSFPEALLPATDSLEFEDSFIVQCGKAKKGVALIWHGQSYSRGEWPWLVAIYQNKDRTLSFVCSGTLVSDRHVITAAHCIHNKDTSVIVVKVGVYNLDDWGAEVLLRKLESAVIHEGFNKANLSHDIALFTLEQSVQYNSNIKPACLWSGNPDLNRIVGQTGVVTGWGDNEIGKGGHGDPRMIRLPIVSTTDCRASKPDFHKLTSETTLCAGNRDGSGPCSGDSGGGLFVLDDGRWKLRGIVSLALSTTSADKRCNLDEYVVFTDAAKYLTWIKKHMQF
ncbi:unnamed protein product [Parnassius mnemosyne]|uniref:Peptidase S1 domain-containing protein n=1 Tax=Parnassius mnemosyne TaxID=213953 RepID=A0AAV1L6Y2_9NEOP